MRLFLPEDRADPLEKLNVLSIFNDDVEFR